jgi:tetratricopeptide (TPR) repeat protein
VTHRLVPACFVAALAIGALACSSPEETIQRHLERAEAYEESMQYDRALAELQAALKVGPGNADTNLRIAHLLEKSEEYDTALFYYEEARRLDPSSDDAALGLAHLLRFEETDRASELIEEVLARTPSSVLGHVLRSDVQLIRGELPGALASALTAAELDPKSARVALQVAMARKASIAERRQKNQPDDPKLFEAADAAFAHAIELARSDPYWMARAVTERVGLLVRWRGYGPEPVQIFQDAFAALKDAPEQQRRIAESSARYARAAKDAEFLHWALSRAVEVNPRGYDAWIELASVAAQRGEDDLAVLARMVEKLPDDPQAQITYAEQLMARDRHAEAAAHLERALPGSKAPAPLLAELVKVQLAAGDHVAALGALDRLRADHADSGPADQAEAMVADAEGRLGDAIKALERWTGREETVIGFAMLADVRVRAGNPRGALDAVDRALALKSGRRPDLQNLRGRILVRLGEHRSALQAFSRARSSGGPLPPAYLTDLAGAFYALGRDDEARKALERALAVEKPAATALLLFAREEAERDPKAAREALERGNQLYPGVLQFVSGLANADLRERKPEAALERVRATVAVAPDAPEARLLLVRLLVTRGLTDEAVKEVEGIQERWPAHPGAAELYLSVMTLAGRGEDAFQRLAQKQASGQLSPYGRVLLARLHAARGEDETARDLLRSALKEVPDLPGAANDLAYLLARRGEDIQEATELAQEARVSRPDSAEIADTLGFVYMRRNLSEAALVQFDAAVDLAEAESPAWATAQYHRGLALRELGRQEEAVLAIEQALASGADFAEATEAHKVLAELAAAGPTGETARDGS